MGILVFMMKRFVLQLLKLISKGRPQEKGKVERSTIIKNLMVL